MITERTDGEVAANIEKEYGLLPEAKLRLLPTPRLLAYYRKRCVDGPAPDRGYNPIDDAYQAYLDGVKKILAEREHVPRTN